MSKRYEIKFYVGTQVDKSGERVLHISQKFETARQLLVAEFEAFTEYEHSGVWGSPPVSESGVTYVCVIDEPRLWRVTYVAGQLRDVFHQSCVLATRSEVEAEFI